MYIRRSVYQVFRRLAKYVHYYYFFDTNTPKSAVEDESSYSNKDTRQFFRIFLWKNWLCILIALMANVVLIGVTIAFDFGYAHIGDASVLAGAQPFWCEAPRS